MQTAIIIDANDIKKILAEKYHVPESRIIKMQYSFAILKDDKEDDSK